MKHLKSTLRMYLILSLVFLFLNACQEKKPENNKPAETNQAAAPMPMTSDIPLDVLSIPIEEFKKIELEQPNNRNVILKPYMENGHITLRGWIFKKNVFGKISFEKVDYLNLKKDSTTALMFGESTYLGSQILYKQEIKIFIDKLASVTGDLLFTPEIYQEGGEKHIRYRISPRSSLGNGLIDPEMISNPSPPRKMEE